MIRGSGILWLAAIGLAAVSLRATESYATRYQSLPALDWLESRPPLAQAGALPAATDLARGLVAVLPLLAISDDAHSRLPSFGPPAYVQRTIGGVRDAARIELSTPPSGGAALSVGVAARLDVVVFNRGRLAQAFADLMARETDIRDAESAAANVRLSGPDERDAVWVIAPRSGGGVATISGYRGPVNFVLQVTYLRTTEDMAGLADLSARAEALARQTSATYAGWLETQIK